MICEQVELGRCTFVGTRTVNLFSVMHVPIGPSDFQVPAIEPGLRKHNVLDDFSYLKKS